MVMTTSKFIRRLRFRPNRHVPFQAEPTTFQRHLFERPKQFLLDFTMRPVPQDQCRSAPSLVTRFLGRVIDVHEDVVEVILWHLPSGSEARSELSQKALSGDALPGDLILFWTWMEIEDGAPRSNEYGDIFERMQTKQQRQDLSALAERLKTYLEGNE